MKAVDDGMKKLVNTMKNKDRETIFIFSSDNGAVQIFDNPDKVRALRMVQALPGNLNLFCMICLEKP